MTTTFLNNIFNERDKPIYENSEKLYTRNLEKLNENKPVTDLKFFFEKHQGSPSQDSKMQANNTKEFYYCHMHLFKEQ